MGKAAGICPRCGNAVGLAHTLPECDAMYDARYRTVMDRLGSSVRTTLAQHGTATPAVTKAISDPVSDVWSTVERLRKLGVPEDALQPVIKWNARRAMGDDDA